MVACDRFLLENNRQLHLSGEAFGYLQALGDRFHRTNLLMHPLPSQLKDAVENEMRHASPQRRHDAITARLAARESAIRDHSREVGIDIFLLHGFEGQMDHFHRLPH